MMVTWCGAGSATGLIAGELALAMSSAAATVTAVLIALQVIGVLLNRAVVIRTRIFQAPVPRRLMLVVRVVPAAAAAGERAESG